MPPTNPTSFQFIDYPVFNALVPSEGPKVVPAQFDFTIASSYSVDLSDLVFRKYITLVQTLFIYNPGTEPVTITFDVAGQNIVFPPQSEGYVPVLVTNPPKCTITSVGGASNVGVFFINVPMPSNIWPIVTYIPPSTAGLLQVQDAILESIVSGGFANVLNNRTVNNDGVKAVFRNDGVGATGTTAAAGNTLLHTAAAGLQFFVDRISLVVPGNGTLAAAGVLTIQLRDNATVIAQWGVFLPNAVPATPAPTLLDVTINDLGYISSAAAAPLNLNLSAALTNGNVFYSIGVGDTAQTQ